MALTPIETQRRYRERLKARHFFPITEHGRQEIGTSDHMWTNTANIISDTHNSLAPKHGCSMDRILYAVFIHENKSQGISTPVSLTHRS